MKFSFFLFIIFVNYIVFTLLQHRQIELYSFINTYWSEHNKFIETEINFNCKLL